MFAFSNAVIARLLLSLLLLPAGLFAAGPRPLEREPGPDDKNLSTLTNAPLKEIEPGIFELGGVRLNKKSRSVSFPASVNMREGPAEYLLVHQTGKLHEAVLKTEIEPYHIHLALLLVTPQKAAPVSEPAGPPELRGPRVTVQLHWKEGTEEREGAGEDWIFNTATSASASRGPWIHNGSRVVNGLFLAQRDGSILSLIADPDALINSPRPGRDNDDLWQAHTKAIPSANTPVRVTIRLEEAP
jgi:hypothetical protein